MVEQHKDLSPSDGQDMNPMGFECSYFKLNSPSIHISIFDSESEKIPLGGNRV